MVVVVIEIKAQETASTFIISRNPNSAEHKFRRSPYQIETKKNVSPVSALLNGFITNNES
jgi:hypothetical protein